MSRILKAYDRDIFQISDHFIKVVFPYVHGINITNHGNGDNVGDNVGDNQIEAKIMLLMDENPKITTKMLSFKLHISTRTISRIAQKLREAKKLSALVPQEQEHGK